MQPNTFHLKSISSSTVLYSAPQILGLLGSLILIPIFTRYLSPEDFGLLALFLSITGIGVSFSGLKMESAMYRYNSEYEGSSRKDFLATIFFTKIFLAVIISTLFLSLIIIGLSLGFEFEKIPFNPYIPSIAFLIFLISCSGFQLALFVAEEKPTKHVSILISSFFITNFLALFFVVYLGEDIWGRIKAMLITETIIFVLMLALTLKAINFSFRMVYIKRSLRFSLPLYMGELVNLIYQYTDRFVLAFYVDISKLGLLYISDRIAILIQSLFRGFEKTINPFIFNQKNQETQKSALENIFILTVSVSCLILFLYLNLSEVFLKEFIGPEYNDISVIHAIKVLGIAYFLTTVYPFFSIALGIEEKTSRIFKITFISALLNFLLNLTLIPLYGWLAATFSTLISCVFTCVGLGYFSRKETHITFNYKFAILLPMLTVATYFLLNNLFIEYSLLHVTLKIIAGTSFLLIMMFKIFNLMTYINNIK